MQITRVLLVDDHPAILDALEHVFADQSDMAVVGRAANGEDAVSAARTLSPDVVVIDLMLPDAHGLDIVRSILAVDPRIRTLVFSMHSESVHAERAMRAGASGYLMKSAATTEVADAVRTIIRGEVFLSPLMSQRVLRNITRPGGHDSGFDVDLLTDQEMNVLQLMGEGDSVFEIARKMKLGHKTVETYRRRTRRKLGLKSIEELLRFAIQFRESDALGRTSHMRQNSTVRVGHSLTEECATS